MSIHDNEFEYQQWREEKEDWEMMQDTGRYDIRVGDMVEWIDASGIDPPLCDSELKTPKEIAFVGRDGWVSFDKPDNPEIDTGDWHPRRFRVVERPNDSGLVYCYCHGQLVRLAGENEPDANDLDQVGLLQAEIAGLKQGIAKHGVQVAELNETIENLRIWRAETVFRHQQEVDGLKAKIADYVHVQEELKATIREYRQEATGRDIEAGKFMYSRKIVDTILDYDAKICLGFMCVAKSIDDDYHVWKEALSENGRYRDMKYEVAKFPSLVDALRFAAMEEDAISRLEKRDAT